MSRPKTNKLPFRIVIDPDMDPGVIVLKNVQHARRECRCCGETYCEACFIDNDYVLHKECANCRAGGKVPDRLPTRTWMIENFRCD